MVEKNILEKAYEKAKETVHLCSTKNGLYASGGKKGYKGVWSRDSMITLIGACSDDDPKFGFAKRPTKAEVLEPELAGAA